jgi:phenylacetate-CoA ligase
LLCDPNGLPFFRVPARVHIHGDRLRAGDLTMAHPLERFYPYMPIWLQNAAISAFGFGWRRERLGGAFRQDVVAFHERDGWCDDRFTEHLNVSLQRVLVYSIQHVAHYREAWATHGLTCTDLKALDCAGLMRLPVTPKAAVRVAPERFLADGLASDRTVRRYPTSGSSGTPIVSMCRPDDHRRFMAAREVRSFGWAGTTMLRSRSMIGGRLVVPKGAHGPPYYRFNAAEKQVYLSAYHIGPSTVRHYVDALNRFKPEVLTGYAYSHVTLARLMLDRGLSLNYQPAALVLGSEKLTTETKLQLQAAIGARAFEEYGSVENCLLATECEAGSLHVSSDFGIVELLDDVGAPVAPGQPGRVVATCLLNYTQPLIRYELGDIASWSLDPCRCGRSQHPVLREVVGRVDDVLTGPDGRQVVMFHGVFLGLPSVHEGQLVQETTSRIAARVVAPGGLSAGESSQIVARIRQRLGDVTVRVDTVPHIERTERGKFRAVVSLLPKPGAAGE